jgi:hypothetical protein
MNGDEANKKIEDWENEKKIKHETFCPVTGERKVSFEKFPECSSEKTIADYFRERASLYLQHTMNPPSLEEQIRIEKNRPVIMAQWQYDELQAKAKEGWFKRLVNLIMRKR